MNSSACGICEKHLHLDEFIIFEDHGLVVSHMPPAASGTAYLGYCFIEPKRHLLKTSELSDVQAQHIGVWIKRLEQAHSDLLSAVKTYFFKFADITPHYHIHVYPRHPSTPPELVGEAVRHWAEAPQGQRSEILRLCKEMRAYFL